MSKDQRLKIKRINNALKNDFNDHSNDSFRYIQQSINSTDPTLNYKESLRNSEEQNSISNSNHYNTDFKNTINTQFQLNKNYNDMLNKHVKNNTENARIQNRLKGALNVLDANTLAGSKQTLNISSVHKNGKNESVGKGLNEMSLSRAPVFLIGLVILILITIGLFIGMLLYCLFKVQQCRRLNRKLREQQKRGELRKEEMENEDGKKYTIIDSLMFTLRCKKRSRRCENYYEQQSCRTKMQSIREDQEIVPLKNTEQLIIINHNSNHDDNNNIDNINDNNNSVSTIFSTRHTKGVEDATRNKEGEGGS